MGSTAAMTGSTPVPLGFNVDGGLDVGFIATPPVARAMGKIYFFRNDGCYLPVAMSGPVTEVVKLVAVVDKPATTGLSPWGRVTGLFTRTSGPGDVKRPDVGADLGRFYVVSFVSSYLLFTGTLIVTKDVAAPDSIADYGASLVVFYR